MPIILTDNDHLRAAVERMSKELERLNKIVQGSGVIVAHGTKFDIDKSARVSEILNNIAAMMTVINGGAIAGASAKLSNLTSGIVPRATIAGELTNGTIQDNGTNVGIGQAPGTEKLGIAGNIKNTGSLDPKNVATTCKNLGVARKACFPLGRPRTLDLTLTDAALKGFIGGFTDGRYGYFVPSHNGAYFGKIARVDLNDFTTVTVLDLTLTDAALKGFIGGFTDGRYGYFVPYHNGASFGKIARIMITNGCTINGSF